MKTYLLFLVFFLTVIFNTIVAMPQDSNINCLELLEKDRQFPAPGNYAYRAVGSLAANDQRCEGKIVQNQANTTPGFVIDRFQIGDLSAVDQNAEKLYVFACGLSPNDEGLITILSAKQNYRLDFLISSNRFAIWPLEDIAKKIALDFSSLSVRGRRTDTERLIFFPVDIRTSDRPDNQNMTDLQMSLHYTGFSPRISVFLGDYSENGDCEHYDIYEANPIETWEVVTPLSPLNLLIPASANKKFCLLFSVEKKGKGGFTRTSDILFFSK